MVGSLRELQARSGRWVPRQSAALCIGLLVGLLLGSVPGCATWNGARLYQEGTEALERGEVDRAIELLRASARLAPEASEVQNHLGIAMLAAGREREALDSFVRATELDCNNQAASDNLAMLRERILETPSDER